MRRLGDPLFNRLGIKTVPWGLGRSAGAPCNLLHIGHETGDLSEYDAITDNGDISVTVAAALRGTNFGLELDTTDTQLNYGEKDFIAPASGILRVRAYIDPNSLAMANNDKFDFITVPAPGEGPPGMLHEVKLVRRDPNYKLVVDTNDDNDVQNDTAEYTITDAPHYIEWQCLRASGVGIGDGEVKLWIDGELKETVSNIDTFLDWNVINSIWFGIVQAIDAGTSGIFYLDELCVNDTGEEIGA